MKQLYFYSCCLYLLLSACNANTSVRKKSTASEALPLVGNISKQPEPGKISAKIACLTDTNISFALYLPKSYDTTQKFPVIYLFDPEGAGALPLNLYKNLADKYGYILIGSNNSKNGLAPDKSDYLITILLNDTKNRFNINTKRMYTSGFSGGARVAVDVALTNSAIIGVAGCGAGFPSLNKPIDPTFLYISFAGNQDFNLTELKNLDAKLNTLPIRHFLIEFDGKHEWPTEGVYDNTFYAFEFNAMQKGWIPKNDTLINRFIQTNEFLLINYKSNNQIYNEYNLYKKMIFFLGKLANVTSYYTQLVQLQNSASFKTSMEQKKAIETEEEELQESYVQAFLQKDIAWWKAEIKKMNNQKTSEPGLMYKRLKSYLGLVVYMHAVSALSQNNTNAADRLLTIYKLLEPENKEQAYLFATLYAKKGETDNALTALQEAKRLGFRDVKRLMADKAFEQLQQNSTFKELVSQLYAASKP